MSSTYPLLWSPLPPVCHLCNPLRVGTETAVLISHHINLAVLVN